MSGNFRAPPLQMRIVGHTTPVDQAADRGAVHRSSRPAFDTLYEAVTDGICRAITSSTVAETTAWSSGSAPIRVTTPIQDARRIYSGMTVTEAALEGPEPNRAVFALMVILPPRRRLGQKGWVPTGGENLDEQI
ncbi:hypothetical protein [Arthrobacter sp. RIT-PI-e]|uniref:hypothetical protein n=1 Tax=Arthrobacter sp. RIT-PI-e TaxID=1681197 RepID=UPI00128EB285|nr:hypothetical protein [Arthrobacter sp. RIT-PI-e]